MSAGDPIRAGARAGLTDLARRAGPATRVRQARAFGGPSAAPRRPALVKSISVQHGREGARATLRYVARLREADRDRGDAEPQVYDEWGDPVARGQALQALDGWALTSEADAESDLARALRAAAEDSGWRDRLLAWQAVADADAADAERRRAAARSLARDAGLRIGGARSAALLERAAGLVALGVRPEDLEPARRYGRVATRHLAATVPLADERQAGAFEVAVSAFVREVFAAEGRPVLWAVHKEHGKEVHAHLLVRNLDEAGRALAFDREGAELDRLREALARHARALGFDVEATRHGDRPELVDAVVEGAAALPRSFGRAEAARGQGVARLEAAAPLWLTRHGAGYARRLVSRALGHPDAPEAGEAAPVPTGYEGVADALLRSQVYADASAAAAAVSRFADLRAEELARTGRDTLARWYMVHAPLLFGAARRGRRADRAALAAVFRGLPDDRKSVVLTRADNDLLARVVHDLSVVHEMRRRAQRRVVDLARLARQREDLARRLEGFGAADDLRAAVALRTSVAALINARREARRLVDPLRSVTVRDPLRERGRGA